MEKKLASWAAFFVLLWLAMASLSSTSFAIPQPSSSDEQYVVDFETRLRFYLDMKTRRFLERMSLKEQVLTDMINGVANEIQLRGGQVTSEMLGMDQIYERENQLIDAYQHEISVIKRIIEQVDSLSQVVQRREDWKLMKQVEEIKLQLMQALERSKLKPGLSTADMSQMINEYSSEIKHLLELFQQIESFQKRAAAHGDDNLVKELERQKSRILQIVEQSRISSAKPDRIVEEYIKETADIVGILKEIEQLQTGAVSDSAIEYSIEKTRERLMSSIDDRLLELFDYSPNRKNNRMTISEKFMQWKAARLAEYQVNYTRYKILHNKLIQTGAPEQRDRMLEVEISNALLNYADGKYELAAMQFDRILNDFQEYYPNLDGVIFYRSEANFANNYYDEAQKGYLDILQNYPNSKFRGQCHLRLLAINYTYQLEDEFFNHYSKLSEFENLDEEDLNKAHYLAADIYIRNNQYEQAKEALEKIKEDSKYYLVAQYLQGVVFANLNDYKSARATFEKIINQKVFPWNDLNNAIIRNEALLKLGYLYYQLGDYDRALNYFTQMSAGYESYDQSLIGQAWANLKKGRYETVIGKANALFSNYVMTNYVYEAKVLAAHCKRAQNRTREALNDLRYVANARQVRDKVEEYNKERRHLLDQLNHLEALEEKVLEHQDRSLYPKIVRARNLINEALASFKYRSSVPSRAVDEYSQERKILVKQIDEFDRIIEYAQSQGDKKLLQDALKQRNRLVSVLQQYQFSQPITPVSYFLDYPMATKEAGVYYQKSLVNQLIGSLAAEKRELSKDLQAVTELSFQMSEDDIDMAVDLEVLREDLTDLNKQLNRIEIWLRNHQIDDVETETIKWANFSGFGISDINFSQFREKNQQIMAMTRNLNKIENILREKKEKLERKIARFDEEMMKIQKEMEAEKIRLEKLEKEKYFQELYFDTKTREVQENNESRESLEQIFNNGRGKN